MNKQDQAQLDHLMRHGAQAVRSTIDKTLYSTTGVAARATSSAVLWGLIAFLGFFFFLFLNIALGFALSDWLGSSVALGFLALSGIYFLLLLLIWLTRHTLHRSIRNSVAAPTLRIAEDLHAKLDTLPYIGQARSQTISLSTRHPYAEVLRLAEDASYVSTESLRQAKLGIAYFRQNYMAVARRTAIAEVEVRLPGYRYIAPALRFLGVKGLPMPEPKSKPQLNGQLEANKKGKWKQYAPYALMAVDIIRPVLFSFTVSKIQGYLSSLLGIGKKNRKSKGH